MNKKHLLIRVSCVRALDKFVVVDEIVEKSKKFDVSSFRDILNGTDLQYVKRGKANIILTLSWPGYLGCSYGRGSTVTTPPLKIVIET